MRARAASPSERSTGWISARTLKRPRIRSRAAARSASVRAARCTSQPSRARLSAAAYPMPFDAPVMSAVRPAIPRSIRLLLCLLPFCDSFGPPSGTGAVPAPRRKAGGGSGDRVTRISSRRSVRLRSPPARGAPPGATRRRAPLLKLLQPRDDPIHPDLVGVEHRPAPVDGPAVAVDPHHVDVARPKRDPFLQDLRPFVDHRYTRRSKISSRPMSSRRRTWRSSANSRMIRATTGEGFGARLPGS